MKKNLLIFCSVFFVLSCSKEVEKVVIPGEVIGKWRLESLHYPMPNKTISYDKETIVFSFDKSVVTVSGNDGSFYIENGVYPYSLNENENENYTMKIGESEYPCAFVKDKMIFSWAYVDGEVLTFRKL